MINLLQETIKTLNEHGKTPQDVLWVGGNAIAEIIYDEGENVYCRTTWDGFVKEANKSYGNGCGGAEVHKDLIIVGADWWLKRHKYDGAEYWEYKTIPNINDYPVGDVKIFYQW